MRSIPANSLAKLATQYGTEPVSIIEIQWVPDGPRFVYGDKASTGIQGKIVELGEVDAAQTLQGGAQSLSVSVVLDDVDGEVKALLDTNDIHKRPAWVYQSFEGLADADKFLIFRGEVASPIVWDEGARTVSFDIISKLEDAEVGFSIEEGQFPPQPDDLIGKAWPLVFGSPCDVPALRVRSARQGVLKAGVGIRDFTLANRICQAGYLLCPVQSKGTTTQFVDDALTDTHNQGADEDCAFNRCQTIADLKFQLAQQVAYEYTTIEVIGGNQFPQGTPVVIDIDGGKFTGTFSGETFTIADREHPDFATTTLIDCAEVGSRTMVRDNSYATGFTQIGGTGSFQPPDFTGTSCTTTDLTNSGLVPDGGAAVSQKLLDDMPTSSFFWARSGSTVTLASEDEIVYIANLLPSDVIRVASKRNLPTGDILQTVPEDYYDVFQVDFGGYTVTEIVFDRPLSKETGDWSDDIYVTLESTVGPNTVDILQYLIEKYTDFSIDAASFTAVHTKLANYPSHFALLDRTNILQVLQEIAYQARCGVTISDNTVYLTYLAEEPTSVDTFTEDDVDVNTLKLTHTPTEDLVTKHILRWHKSLAKDQNTLILRNNVSKYGTIPEEYDYYIYNDLSLVEKSGTFWMIRKSNTWRRATFSAPLSKLAIEVYDCITLDLPDIAPAPIKAIVESAKYNSENNVIDFECWLPAKSGTTTQYIFAWPASASATATFPTDEEIAAGLAGGGPGDNADTIPPDGHILGATSETDPEFFVQSWGDDHPSDADDSVPTITCPAGDDVILDEIDPVIEALKRAQRADQKTQEIQETAGGVQVQEENEKKGCGGRVGPRDCIYQVDIQYCTPQICHKHPGDDPFQSSTPGFTGQISVCGPTTSFCHQFNSRTMAQYFQQYHQQQIDAKRDGYAYIVGTQDEVGAFFVGEVLRGEDAGTCQDPPANEEQQTGAASGEPTVPAAP